MDIKEIMNLPAGYTCGMGVRPAELQRKAKLLCARYNQTTIDEPEERKAILKIFWEHIIP